MQWNVHVKNELGRDDNVAVAAESEIAAERVAAQHGSVAVVVGAYPADDTVATSPPSWMGGPANTNPPRRSLEPTWGHSAAYNGEYNSKGGYAGAVRRSTEQADRLADLEREVFGIDPYAAHRAEVEGAQISLKYARDDEERDWAQQRLDDLTGRHQAPGDTGDSPAADGASAAESYHGPYASNADQVMETELSRSLGVQFANTRAEVSRAREALAQIRDQQTGRPGSSRAASAEDRYDADGR